MVKFRVYPPLPNYHYTYTISDYGNKKAYRRRNKQVVKSSLNLYNKS